MEIALNILDNVEQCSSRNRKSSVLYLQGVTSNRTNDEE